MSAPRLAALSVDDFGLIRRARIDFSGGLTVFSGETGSGKTMLLGALRFALGERAAADVVRTGASRAVATVEIDLDEPARTRLKDAGFEIEAGEFAVISREMNAQGKSAARINGRPAAAAAVRDFAECIVDFIGQHEQQRLLSGAYQGDLLDRFAGDETLVLRAALARTHAIVSELRDELHELGGSERRAAAEIEDARLALRDIDEVTPIAGEDRTLRERRDVLSNAEQIAQALDAARDALVGREGSAVDRIGDALSALGRVTRGGSQLAAIQESLAAAESALTEATIDIARRLATTELDPGELDGIAERLDRIERLKRRYGGSIEAIASERERLTASVASYEARDEQIAGLRARADEAFALLHEQAAELSERRQSAARVLEARVAEELQSLSMPAARFGVTFAPLEAIGPRGAERVEFALSPNAGEPPRALARAASGGELSRVLLALVVVLADRRERTALVFDEIDAGIGGAAAAAVGERLGALARHTQVACVTHLAQIASWADVHYTLRKRERPGDTAIETVSLDRQADVEAEIARMLSGSAAKVALDHASTLLRDARKRKGRLRISA